MNGMGMDMGMGMGSPMGYDYFADFTVAYVGGAVDGKAAGPGPGLMHVTNDSASLLATSGGELVYPALTAAQRDPEFRADPITRTPGRIIIGKFKLVTAYGSPAGGGPMFGLMTTTSGNAYLNNNGSMRINSTGPVIGVGVASTTFIDIASVTADVFETVAMITKAAGNMYFLWVGGLPYLLYFDSVANTSTLHPAITSIVAGRCPPGGDFVKVPSGLWMPPPLISEGFGVAFGVSDGLGHAEGIAGGMGAGGSGVVWTTHSGVAAVSAGKAVFTTAGEATAPLSTADVLLRCKVTLPSAGVTPGGILLRYKDANNYWYLQLVPGTAGNDFNLIEVNAGVPTTRATADRDWVADTEYEIKVQLYGDSNWRIYVDDVSRLTYTTTNTFNQTEKRFGVKDEGNSNFKFDDFVAFPIGTAGEHANGFMR